MGLAANILEAFCQLDSYPAKLRISPTALRDLARECEPDDFGGLTSWPPKEFHHVPIEIVPHLKCKWEALPTDCSACGGRGKQLRLPTHGEVATSAADLYESCTACHGRPSETIEAAA